MYEIGLAMRFPPGGTTKYTKHTKESDALTDSRTTSPSGRGRALRPGTRRKLRINFDYVTSFLQTLSFQIPFCRRRSFQVPSLVLPFLVLPFSALPSLGSSFFTSSFFGSSFLGSSFLGSSFLGSSFLGSSFFRFLFLHSSFLASALGASLAASFFSTWGYTSCHCVTGCHR